MQKSPIVLIADDDASILTLLTNNLSKQGYRVITAKNGQDALEQAIKHVPDAILLDVSMPICNGLEACKQIKLKKNLQHIPVLFLTAQDQEEKEVQGFDAGAVDFIAKSGNTFSKFEALSRRIQATLVQSNKRSNHLHVGGLELNKAENLVLTEGEKIFLRKKEFDLLFFLASNPNEVYDRSELLEAIWGDIHVVDRTVDVHIRRLREKIGDSRIKTVIGRGYSFVC